MLSSAEKILTKEMSKKLLFCSFYILITYAVSSAASERSFTVDYVNNTFLKDGKPFRYVSGSLHYFRVPYQLWGDRIQKMKMAGLNAIQTYVEWGHHEQEPGVYNFEYEYDLVYFLQTVQSYNMLVIIRPGPFIDAERDMGGLPYWLLRMNPDIKLRTYDSTYIKYVTRWYSVLLAMLRPLLYKNGGPIIMMQIENEYGSTVPCDAQYTSYLRKLFNQYLEDDVLYFTTDGSNSKCLTCGKVDQVLSTFDFGAGVNVTDLIDMLRWHQSSGPVVNSEFYPGWLDHWGQPHNKVSADDIVDTLTEILTANASVNIYMFHGGTSFGFSAGANLGSTYQACPTSYDYDAPLSEAGDPTPKYYKIRETIGKFLPLPNGTLPEPSPKLNISSVQLKKTINIWDYIADTKSISNPDPLSFEAIKQPYGFVLYEVDISFDPTDPALLTVPKLADRGYVFIDKIFQGILSREHQIFSMPLKVLKSQKIAILVENQGRVCFGDGIHDFKGIFKNVTLGSQTLFNWTMTPIPLALDYLSKIPQLQKGAEFKRNAEDEVPSFYEGTFTVEKGQVMDTFLLPEGWHKGVAFVNSYNLGRYWPIAGPQVTLYVPGVWLYEGSNTIKLLELEQSPCSTQMECTVKLVDEPIIDAPTPSDGEISENFYGRKYLRTTKI